MKQYYPKYHFYASGFGYNSNFNWVVSGHVSPRIIVCNTPTHGASRSLIPKAFHRINQTSGLTEIWDLINDEIKLIND